MYEVHIFLIVNNILLLSTNQIFGECWIIIINRPSADCVFVYDLHSEKRCTESVVRELKKCF